MEAQYIQFQQGYLDPETGNRVVKAAAVMLPFWEDLGFELDDRDFHEAIRRNAGR